MDIDKLTPREASLYTKLFLAEREQLSIFVSIDKSGNAFEVRNDLLVSKGRLTEDGFNLLNELTEKQMNDNGNIFRKSLDERD